MLKYVLAVSLYGTAAMIHGAPVVSAHSVGPFLRLPNALFANLDSVQQPACATRLSHARVTMRAAPAPIDEIEIVRVITIPIDLEGTQVELRANPGETVVDAVQRFTRANSLEEDEDLIKSLQAAVALRAKKG
mmetsp:Transcript_20758/g.40313  ORF Transcript_20758/g.40313 Transcript_20758/m.40313 type:complete len:133 (-) Transcript_20758:369-767(-)|eukprot:6206587-Pleurochrysis_carterae.AAC.1